MRVYGTDYEVVPVLENYTIHFQALLISILDGNGWSALRSIHFET
jgi:hypothetical protein